MLRSPTALRAFILMCLATTAAVAALPTVLPDETGQGALAGNQSQLPREDAQVSPGKAPQRNRQLTALQPFAVLIGDWRGVGQPRRGSRVGAWVEKSSAAWDFTGAQPTIALKSTDGLQFETLELHQDPASHSPVMTLIGPGDRTSQLNLLPGKEGDQSMVFISEAHADDEVIRCTVRIISEIRVTMLFEQQKTSAASFRRLAEIGYTRAGERLASGNAGERQCVVTGGLGTISVTHDGKTYYVCCQGCRQAFEADPAGTIADYKERLKADSEKKN